MKFFKYSCLLFLLFTKCLGMGFFFDKSEKEEYPSQNPNPDVTKILIQLKKEHAEKTLRPETFWALIAKPTGMGSCFLGEFIANSYEEDVCLVFEYLIKFGPADKNKFYEYIIRCVGIDGITPINELIRYIPSADSRIYKLFLQILSLIKTLDPMQKTDILNQRDMYGTDPITTAQRENKLYIANAIATTLFSDAGAAQWAHECGFDRTLHQRTKSLP
ncbi:MAG: hypothetical protein V1646_02590 [bacterium]